MPCTFDRHERTKTVKILVGYGYSPITTGRYLEECLSQGNEVVFVGTDGDSRPGLPSNVDLGKLVEGLASRPDLFLYVDSGERSYLPYGVETLECPTAALLIDVHLGGRLRRPLSTLFDYVFVAQRDFVSSYQSGPSQHVEWLPLACDPAVHKLEDLPRTYDVGFVGNIGSKGDRRRRLLKALESRFTLNDYRRHYPREAMAGIYSQSKIVFNCAIANDVNMRVFEAMASGALLVTNRVGNGLLDLFQDGKHIVTYETESELLDRVAFYLDHADEREEIARAGQALVLANHTYARRADCILNTVFRQAPGARAPLCSASQQQRIALYAELYSKFRLLDASFDMLNIAFSQKQARLWACVQFAGAVLRRVRHG